MKKIERPRFYRKLLSGVDTKEPVITEEDFDLYFQQYKDCYVVRESEMVRVRSDEHKMTWAAPGSNFYEHQGNTHQAYLIGIEPIKQETCADVLRDFKKLGEGVNVGHPWSKELCDLFDRAKAALDRGE